MRVLLVLAITIPVLLAFGVACGGDEEKARVMPSPASEAEGETEEAEGWDGEGVAEEEEEGVEADEAAEEAPTDTPVAVATTTESGEYELEGPIEGAEVVADADGDGVPDAVDNCPDDPNPGQEDFDGDLEGDICDADDDDDGFTDADEVRTGSDHQDDASVPENEAMNPGSCSDGVDNDLDGGADTDRGCS